MDSSRDSGDQSRSNNRPRRRRPATGTRRPHNASDGRIIFATGSTGAGKTTWAFRQVPAGRDMLVWDTKGEWSARFDLVPVYTLRHLHALIVASFNNPAPFRVAYRGPMSREHFDTFCRLAWVWIKAKRRRVLVVEELADVTNPGKASQAWGEILRKGRDPYQALIIGLTQRASESDSTIAGNCTVIHSGYQSFPRDRKTISEYLDVPLEEVRNLGELDFIERNMRTRELRRGRMEF